MIPSSEQVARAIVASIRECGIFDWFKDNPKRLLDNPKAGKSDKWDGMRHARAYAALALRKAFPKCPTSVIGRCVGANTPHTFLGILIACRAKGQLAWYDPDAMTRIVEAIGPVEDTAEQVVVDETIPVFLPKVRLNTDPYAGRASNRRRLEDELRQAVLNTGGKLAE